MEQLSPQMKGIISISLTCSDDNDILLPRHQSSELFLLSTQHDDSKWPFFQRIRLFIPPTTQQCHNVNTKSLEHQVMHLLMEDEVSGSWRPLREVEYSSDGEEISTTVANGAN